MRSSRVRHALILCAATALVVTVLAAPPAFSRRLDPPGGKPTPPSPAIGHPHAEHLLPRRLPGRSALAQLGPDELETAAAVNELRPQRLHHLLEDDPAAWMAADGRLYYVEEGPQSATGATAPASPAAIVPTDQTFRLHSLPGASRTIYLDFDGGRVTKTWWNDYAGVPNTDEPAWSTDSDPAFSDAELGAIQDVWARVAEDYAPFAVDVTTEPPAPEAISRISTVDQTYGLHLMIGPSTDAWSATCQQQCGGVALVGTLSDLDASTTSEYLRLGWVFTGGLRASQLATTSKYIADAAAHEAGHIIGLQHDGTATTGYYAGTGLWGPIMGAPYNSAVTQWSNGGYAGANNTEDDTAIIGRELGLRKDGAGDDVSTAMAPPAGSAFIETANDRDLYALGTCTGALTVTARPAALGPDLDLGLTLLDASGRTLASSAPPTTAKSGSPPSASGLDAQISTTVTLGTYYARVDGTGSGSSAYTDYGSLGAYTLATTGCLSARRTAPAPPSNVRARVSGSDLDVLWDAPAGDGGSPIVDFEVRVDGGGWQVEPASARSVRLTGLGTARHAVEVRAVSTAGPSQVALAPTLPAAVGSLRASPDAASRSALLTWSAPTDDGRSPVTSYRLLTLDAHGATVADQAWAGTSARVTGLAPGRTYRFGVRPVNDVGMGPVSRIEVTLPVAPAVTAPAAPTIGRASPGQRGGRITAVVRWAPPRSNGGTAISSYRIRIYQLNARGGVARTTVKVVGVRTSAQVRVLRGKRYRFAVQAGNRVGYGPPSARSAAVRGR